MWKRGFKCAIALMALTGVTGCGEKKTTNSAFTTKIETIVCKDAYFGKVRNSLVDSLSFIPLEETSGAYLSTIGKLMVEGKRVFVFDKLGGNAVVSFDLDGHHPIRYGNRGNGNKEYVMLSDFSVDATHVYLYDYSRKRMLVFSHSGDFVSSCETDFRAKGFAALENGCFLFALEKDKGMRQLCLTDSDLRIKECLIAYNEKETDDKMSDNLFQRCGSVILYHHPVCDSLYVLSSDGNLKECLRMDIKGDNPPAELQFSYEGLIENGGKEKYTFLYDCPLLANGVLLCSVFSHGDKACILYNSKTKKAAKSVWCEGLKLSDMVFPLCVTDDAVIGWMDYSIYSASSDKSLVPHDVVSHLENGGHALVVYHLKGQAR